MWPSRDRADGAPVVMRLAHAVHDGAFQWRIKTTVRGCMSDMVVWSTRLEKDGFLERRHTDGLLHTTRRWHAALARAALRLYKDGNELEDMRTPIAAVLVDHYADEEPSSLADGIRTMYMVALSEVLTLSVPALPVSP